LIRALVFSIVVGSVALATPGAQVSAGAVSLRVNAFSSRAGERIRLTAVAELSTPGIKLKSASITLADANGKPAGQWTAKPADLTKLTGPTLVTTFDVSPGTYRVHATVTDAAGAKGAADATVTAALTPAARPLTLGSLMIGIDGTGGAPFAPRLQFRSELAATAMFELYGGSTGMPVSIAMEIVSIKDDVTMATLLPKITATPEPDRFIVTAPVDLAALPPGDYAIRAVVGLDGQPATTILGTWHKIA
jgi:hypothetical protein